MRALLWLDACPARDIIRLGAKPVWSVRIPRIPRILGLEMGLEMHLEICLQADSWFKLKPQDHKTEHSQIQISVVEQTFLKTQNSRLSVLLVSDRNV